MKKLIAYSLLPIAFLFSFEMMFGQEQRIDLPVFMKDGVVHFDENFYNLNKDFAISADEVVADRYYRFVQFYSIPNQEQMKALSDMGVRLLEYIPRNVYVASIPKSVSPTDIGILKIRSFLPLVADYKMDTRVKNRTFPAWAKQGNEIRLLIQYFSDIDPELVKTTLASIKIPIQGSMDHAHLLTIQVAPNRIDEIANLSFVRYLDFESEPGEPESDDGRNLHRSTAIDVDYFGGYDYDGTGVSVAINDDGFAGPHIDFHGRADQSDVANDFTGTHGDMTVGIVGAAGNVDPTMRGMAPGAFLWVRQYYSSLPNTVTLHQYQDVMVFSSSYSNGCNAGYTSTTHQVDEEIYDNPSLIQVFSAGNSNNTDCGYGAGDQWGNITGGHKMGKNVIATANLYNDNSLATSSSRGPASDGRIKPDIAAHGQGHWSTDPDNQYGAGGGTSAAAPGIAGVLAQLHHAYRDLNNGNDAPSALLKASILNTADDLGNPGPDFKFGWGKVNAHKAFRTLEEGRYISGSIQNGSTQNHIIPVPTGVQEMRVMVYWHDVEASTSAAYALVNNLDLTITDGSSTTHFPLVLDHTPNATTLNNTATPGVDSLNNMEQVRITNPSMGNYTVSVNGNTVPFGPQEYFIVYEFFYDDIRVIYPIGGEGLIPGSTERVHWDAYGTSGTFTAQYSLNGVNWISFANNIPGSERFVDFPVPNVVSKAKVRIIRSGAVDESDQFFSIIGRPENIQIGAICSGFNTVQITWDAVPGATAYDVFYLGQMYMDSMGTTSGLNYSIAVPTTNQDHWISVRARGANGIVGRRAIAITGGGDGCYLDCISNDDAGISSLLTPLVNMEACSGTSSNVVVELTNIGSNVQTGFPIFYQFNNGPIVEDTFTNTLAGGAHELFAFSQQISFGAAGTYPLLVWTELPNDGAHCNDTLETNINYNDPLVSYPYVEYFQSGVFPPPTIDIINPDGDKTWEEKAVTGSSGSTTYAAYVNNFAYNNSGTEDYLSIYTFDMANTNFAKLKFDVAYTPYSSSYSDGLRVDVSTDCGLTYTSVYLKEGDSLATISGFTTSTWEPAVAADWRRDSIDLSAFTGGVLKVRFVNINGYGNSLFIDNIELFNFDEDMYCIPSANCNVGDEIDDFHFNTINQTGTGCGQNGYSNFLGLSTELQRGVTYSLSASTNYVNQYLSAWIDFNNDTVFDNTTERVLFDMHMPATDTLFSSDITIASTANLGNHRMRVRARWNASCDDPCTDYSYGETHDYTVNIVESMPLIVSLGGNTTICQSDTYGVFANATGGQTPYTYLWSSGQTDAYITLSPTVTTTYQVTVSDATQSTTTDLFVLSVNGLPIVDLGPDQSILQGNYTTLDAGQGFASYIWSTGETTQTILVSAQGIYSVTVSDTYSCTNNDEVEITEIISPGPGWHVNITSGNHIILVPPLASITVDGQTIEIGDYIGVFYDSLGSLACGGYMAWTGSIGNVTAWAEDLGNDGFGVGENFKWKIWKHTSGTEYSATATYSITPGTPNSDQFVVNGLSSIESLTAIVPSLQSVLLAQGWSMVSSYIQPFEPGIDLVFAPVVSDLVILKDGLGNVYWPQFGVNGVVDMDPTKGYHVNMQVQHTLDIVGIAVDPAATPIVLPQGWSLISYLHPAPTPLADMIVNISSSIVMLKDGQGKVYWPAWSIDMINYLQPGKGYLINVSMPQTLIYPSLPNK